MASREMHKRARLTAFMIAMLTFVVGSGTVGLARQSTADHVEWMWSGGLSASSITITARLTYDTDNARIVVGDASGLRALRYSVRLTAAEGENHRIISATFNDLASDAEYFYTVEVDGELDRDSEGRFRTPGYGAYSFRFAFSACASYGSNAVVFDTIREREPLFFLNTGDLQYVDIEENELALFQEAYDHTLTRPAQAALYQSAPIDYTWDDHDSGGPNANRRSPSMPAARNAYEQLVPHYALPLIEEGVIGHAYTIGRVRFIVTDARGARDPQTDPDGPGKSMLGDAQKAWFKAELLAVSERNALVIWVNAVPWIAEAEEGADSWAGYDHERRELAQFIAELDTDNLLMLSGDAHMLAIDDGSNSNYSDEPGPAFPVMHAAALERPASIKGGPYSEGVVEGSGHFGVVTVQDDGAMILVSLSGRNRENDELLYYEFATDLEYMDAPPFPRDGLHDEPY